MKTSHWLGGAVAALLAATPVLAHHAGEIVAAGDIRVSHAWTEETAAMAHAVEVYLTVENVGEAADRLVAARTDFSQDGVFQATVLDADGSVVVREVAAVQVAPGQSITFQPGGIHIVLNDVKRHLVAGEHFDLTLEFETAGTLTVEVEIEEHGDHEREPSV